DKFVRIWRSITGGRQYESFPTRKVKIHFMGVWDTVAAYGLPIDELTIAVDKWGWPMTFDKRELLTSVEHARQALALDDERRTFHAIPWSERDEAAMVKKEEVKPDRLLQVWFPGMHTDVGGGYPDDGLSLVPLCWMIDEAAELGLNFEPDIV